MATRHEITSIQFKADAGKANAAIDSIRQKAKEAADTVDQLRAKLAEGKSANLPVEQIGKLEDELNAATKAAKQWEAAQKNLMRGVKALDQAIMAFNKGRGSVESMSAALSKAARNAAQLQQTRVDKGSQTWHEMEALILALDKNLLKAKQDVDGLIASINAKERVSDSELRSAISTLKELMDLTQRDSAEWMLYKRQLDVVQKATADIAIEERRLKGEMVDANDARREAGKLTEEWAAGAERVREATEKEIEGRKKYVETLIEERKEKKSAEQATAELVAKQYDQIQAQQEVIDGLEKEAKAEAEAITKKEKNVRKLQEEALAKQKAAEQQEAALEAERRKTVELEGEVQKLKTQLEALNDEPIKPEVDNSDIDKLSEQLEASAAALQKQTKEKKKELRDVGKEVKKLTDDIKGLDEQIEDLGKAPEQPQQGISGISGMKSDVEALTGAIEELKKQRDSLTASQEQGATAAKADGDALKMTAQQAADAIAAMNKPSTFRITGNATTEFSNLEQAQQFLMAQIAKVGTITNSGKYQLVNQNQIDKVTRLFQEKYGMEGDKSGALDIIRRIVTGSNGGLITSGWMQDDQLQITPNREAWDARIAKLKELLAIQKGSAEVTQQQTAATEKSAQAEREQGEIERQKAVITEQINVLEEQRQNLEKQSAEAEKQSAQATENSAEAERKKAELLRQRSELEGQLTEKQGERARIQEEINSTTEAANAKLQEAKELEKQKAEAATQATEADKQKEELIGQLTQKTQELTEQQQRQAAAETKANKASDEAAEATDKAILAEQGLGKTSSDTAKKLEEERGKQKQLNDERDRTVETLEQQQQAVEQVDEQIVAQSQKIQEAEQKKKEAQELTEKGLEDIIALLKKENYDVIPANTEQWRQNKDEIERLEQTLKEMRGEVMSVEDALTLAGQAGGKGFTGTDQQLQKAEQALQKALRTAEKGSVEWENYRSALERVRTEMNNMGMTSERMHEIMDDPSAARNLNELKDAVKRAKAELALMEGTINKNSKEYKELAESTKKAEFRLKELESQSKGTATAFEKAWSRLKTYIGLYMGTAVAIQKLVGAMGDLMELSDKMGEVRKTTAFTADEVGRLSDSLAKLDTRTPIQELLGLSAAAGQLGLKSQSDVRGFTEAANELIVALPEMGRESATSLMKIANATGDLRRNGDDVQETLERVGSTIIALRANSASAAPAITDFVSRVGAVGAQSGITIDQMAALGSTIDALGGRVEMSATALSRMIPAIRNNAFGVANAIGVTEKTLVDLFNQGKSMEAMVLIFRKMRESVKQFDTSTEEGMNAMADNVEALLGKNASMAEVMKELNQQGARAGIVFGLMSQNVDELSRQLGIASKAYNENTALMNEYNNMNETTAAKWAKLKNQLEEFFVSDNAQRVLGNIIDGLRKIVDILTGDGALNKFLRYSILYLGLLKNKWTETIGNAIISVWNFRAAIRDASVATTADAAAKTADAAATTTLGTATEAAAVKTNIFSKAWGKLNAAMKANIIAAVAMAVVYLISLLKDAHDAAQKTAAAILRVKEKTDEEREAVEKLFKPLREANIQEEEKRKLIASINSQYGSYLSKMLTEASNAQEIARAYEAINLQLRKKNILEGMEENAREIRDRNKSKLDDVYGELDRYALAGSVSQTEGASLSLEISRIIKNGIENGLSRVEVRAQLGQMLRERDASGKLKRRTMVSGMGRADWVDTQDLIRGMALEYFDVQSSVQNEINQANKRLQTDLDIVTGSVREAAEKDIPELIADFDKALGKGSDAKMYSADESRAVVDAFDAIKAYYDLHRDELTNEQKNLLNAKMGLSISSFRQKIGSSGSGDGGGGGNPYGTFDRVTSPYSEWDADALVARRKEMLERVRSLANGADVQAVLSQDAKFISEATRNNIKDTRQAIEWYNAERLKIQDALHERYLTNTGDWMEPSKEKKGKRAEKQAKEEMKAYLDMLDAYYTDQQTMIQKAQTKGEITEAEGQRRLLANETTWRERRIELQKLYANKFAEVTRKEQEAIFDIIAEQSDDTADMVENTIAGTVKFIQKIGDKDEAVYRRIMGSLTKDMAVDLNKQQKALSKYQKSVDAILRKGFDSADKAYAQFKETLDTLGVVLSGEEGGVEVFLQRVSKLSEYVREAYKYNSGDEMAEQLMSNSQQAIAELESLQEAAFNRENYAESEALGERMRIEQDFYSWLANTDKQTRDILLAQLQDYSEQYEEAIQKLAQQQAKLDNKRFAKSSEGRAADAVIKTSKDNTDVAQFRSGLMDTGAFGKLDEDRSQLKTLDLEINKQKQLIAYTRELMDARDLELRQQMAKWEAEAAEHQRRMEEIGEEGEGYAELAAAKKTADEQVEALRQSIATQEAVRRQTEMDQQEALDDLMIQHVQKMRDINATMMGTVADYISSFEEFGQSFGEAVYGDKEDRQNAAKELLKEVATTSKKLIQQWLTNMVMKQFINQQEVASDQATAVASESIKAQQTISELGMEASKTTGQVAAGEAGAMAHEVGSKGWLGIAIGAAIGVMLSTLLGVVLGKINKAKSEVASIGGVSAGRLSTGMLTYGGGNVQEVVGDDGVVYRAKDVGRTRHTHVTHHTELTEVGGKPAIVGEKGSELVVPAATTKRLQMNYPYILKAISMVEQHGSLGGYGYGGGMRRGARRYAGGNVDEMVDGAYGTNGTNEAAITAEQAAAMTTALDNAAAAYDRLTEQLKKPVYINMHGPEGLRAKNAEAERFEKKYGKDY